MKKNPNLEEFFSMFHTNNEENTETEKEIEKNKELFEISSNPYVLFGSIIAGHQQYQVIHKISKTKNGEMYEQIEQKVKKKYYDNLFKLFLQLERLGILPEFKLREGYPVEDMLETLKNFLEYYENLEEYEKCIILKKYQDFFKKVKN